MAQAVQAPVLLFLLAAVGVHLVQPGMEHFLALVVAASAIFFSSKWACDVGVVEKRGFFESTRLGGGT